MVTPAEMRFTPPENEDQVHVRLKWPGSVSILPERNTITEGRYRITADVQINPLSPAESGAFEGPMLMEFVAECEDGAREVARVGIPDIKGSPDFRHLLGADIFVPCDKPLLTFALPSGAGTAFLRSVLMVKLGTVMNFATIYERDMWSSDLSPHALFTGDGGSNPRSDDEFGKGFYALNLTPWTLASLRGFALEPGQQYRITLRARADGVPENEAKRIAIGPNGSSASFLNVQSDWTDLSAVVFAPGQAESNHALTLLNPGSGEGLILVDRVTIEEL